MKRNMGDLAIQQALPGGTRSDYLTAEIAQEYNLHWNKAWKGKNGKGARMSAVVDRYIKDHEAILGKEKTYQVVKEAVMNITEVMGRSFQEGSLRIGNDRKEYSRKQKDKTRMAALTTMYNFGRQVEDYRASFEIPEDSESEDISLPYEHTATVIETSAPFVGQRNRPDTMHIRGDNPVLKAMATNSNLGEGFRLTFYKNANNSGSERINREVERRERRIRRRTRWAAAAAIIGAVGFIGSQWNADASPDQPPIQQTSVLHQLTSLDGEFLGE